MSEGPGIIEIALAVALGIGIAYEDGWTGSSNAQPTQNEAAGALVQEQDATPAVKPVAPVFSPR